MDPVKTLAANAAAQLLFSCVLGTLMLVPMQPWGAWLAAHLPLRALLSAHLDWIMLGLSQLGAAFVMDRFPDETESPRTARLLVFGGWVNPTAYVFRGFGVDAFVLGGGPTQVAAALLAGVSALSLVAAWAAIVAGLAGGAKRKRP